MARLYWVLYNERSNTYIKITKELTDAGRVKNCDIVCTSNKVSRKHATFIFNQENGCLFVQDNGSSNGTFLNCTNIQDGRLYQLIVDDEVGLGVHSMMHPKIYMIDMENDFKYIFIVKRFAIADIPDDALSNGVLTNKQLIDVLDDSHQNEATDLKENVPANRSKDRSLTTNSRIVKNTIINVVATIHSDVPNNTNTKNKSSKADISEASESEKSVTSRVNLVAGTANGRELEKTPTTEKTFSKVKSTSPNKSEQIEKLITINEIPNKVIRETDISNTKTITSSYKFREAVANKVNFAVSTDKARENEKALNIKDKVYSNEARETEKVINAINEISKEVVLAADVSNAKTTDSLFKFREAAKSINKDNSIDNVLKDVARTSASNVNSVSIGVQPIFCKAETPDQMINAQAKFRELQKLVPALDEASEPGKDFSSNFFNNQATGDALNANSSLHSKNSNKNSLSVTKKSDNLIVKNEIEETAIKNELNIKEENEKDEMPEDNIIDIKEEGSESEANNVIKKGMCARGGYTIEDGCIIIDDDNDDVPCSQLLNGELDKEEVDTLNDSLFCCIKKELEELDRPEDGKTYACIDLVSTDMEDNEDWLFGDKSSDNHQIEGVAKESVSHLEQHISGDNPLEKQIDEKKQTTCTEKFDNTKGTVKRKYTPPPIISPHLEVKKKCREHLHSKSKGIVLPQKRRWFQKENEQVKKIKTAIANANKKGDGCSDSKREHSDELTKNKKSVIQEIRKQKLKELAIKQREQKDGETTQHKAAAACIKVSNNRGEFLTEICDKPSTSKEKNILRAVKPKIKKKQINEFRIPSNNNNVCIQSALVSPIPTIPQATVLTSYQIPKKSQRTSLYNYHYSSPLNEWPTNCQYIEDVLSDILHWKVIWFNTFKTTKQLPTITEIPLQRMSQNFSNFSNYYHTVKPLLLTELWNYMYKGFLDVADPRKTTRLSQIHAERKTSNCTVLECSTYINKEQNDKVHYVKEEDAVVIQLALQHEGQMIVVPFLGYVTRVFKKLLTDKDFLDSSFVQKLALTPCAQLNFVIVVEPYIGKAMMDKCIYVKPIAPLTPTRRIFRSLKYLEHSPLCKFILKPTYDMYKLNFVNNVQLTGINKDTLNESQRRAVLEASQMCLHDDPGIYLIQGPPGTGKSTVIVNTIQQILHQQGQQQKCILMVAPSNAAVDELTLRLISLKSKLEDAQRKLLKLVRLGPRNMIHPNVERYSLQELAKQNLIEGLLKSQQKNGLHKEICQKRDQILQLKKTSKTVDKHRVNSLKLEFDKLCRRSLGRSYNEHLKKSEENILFNARIICTTLTSCAGVRMIDVFEKHSDKICCCIVDEATQSSEQETLIPLTLGVTKLIIVGDPKQLPAVTLSREAKNCAHGQSLFSRIMSHFQGKINNPIRMLDVQYRMHPAICEFPNKTYYDGRLKNDKVVSCRTSNLNVLQPYLVFNLIPEHENSQEYSSRTEINCVVRLLEAIVTLIGDSRSYSVGIVTPYNHQKEGIIAKINEQIVVSNVSVAVNTVDSFQGQEKDIIILSCVRDYSNNFVGDEQRINVAITRAMYALYIIGTDNLLRTCSALGKIYDDAKSRLLLQTVESKISTADLLQIIKKK